MIEMNRKFKQFNRILIVTAVAVERDAVLAGLGGSAKFDVVVSGVGPIAAAAVTTITLANKTYDLVISVGIGGGFHGQAELGSLVVASEIIVADLGVMTSVGFVSLDELGFGSTRFVVDSELALRVTEALLLTGLPVHNGPILTVSTITGTSEMAMDRAVRIPGALAEGMEGYGVAMAAHQFGVPVLEIRSISNEVGPRDRAAWRIEEALSALETASSILSEVL